MSVEEVVEDGFLPDGSAPASRTLLSSRGVSLVSPLEVSKSRTGEHQLADPTWTPPGPVGADGSLKLS